MAEAGEQQRFFCHGCRNEWPRERNGLQCPRCDSEFIEIIEEHHDPRGSPVESNHDSGGGIDPVNNSSDDSLPRHPLHHHNPWQSPDLDHPDIEHVEWNPAPGVHFTRTSYRSSTPSRNMGMPHDPMAPIFQGFSTMFGNATNPSGRLLEPPSGAPMRAPSRLHRLNYSHRPESPFQHHFPDHHPRQMHPHIQVPWTSNSPQGGRNVFTATGRWPPNEVPSPFSGHPNGANIHGLLTTILQSMHANIADDPNGTRSDMPMPSIQAFITSVLGNGANGDAVYTDEALDRIITQMMDQTNAHSAPGPASAAAIAALPKIKADKSIMGQDGKAECSVCMDAVELGDEVTMLPCKHWFHGDCVGAWLQEHDTCPHCRQGIMPKDAPPTANAPRSPDQEPRNSQPPFQNSFAAQGPPPPPSAPRNHQGGPVPPAFTQPGMQQPYMPGGFGSYPEPQSFIIPPGQQQPQFPPSPPAQSSHQSNVSNQRRRSSARERSSGNGEGSSSSGQGVTSWIRNHFRGGNSSGDR